MLLPWLVVLTLLALPSNRNARAWWIWAPLIVFALLGASLATAFDAGDNDGASYLIQAALAAAFGLAAVWLVGASLDQRGRPCAMALMALAFAAVSMLAFAVSPAAEQAQELIQFVPLLFLYLGLLFVTGGLVYTSALNLVGCICRKGLDRVRVLVWLPFCIGALWLFAGCLLGGVVALVSGGGFDWPAICLLLTLVSFGVVLPFLILSFVCPFYRERLKSLLRLPDAGATPAASTSPLPAAPQAAGP